VKSLASHGLLEGTSVLLIAAFGMIVKVCLKWKDNQVLFWTFLANIFAILTVRLNCIQFFSIYARSVATNKLYRKKWSWTSLSPQHIQKNGLRTFRNEPSRKVNSRWNHNCANPLTYTVTHGVAWQRRLNQCCQLVYIYI